MDMEKALQGYRVPRISRNSKKRIEIKLSPEDLKRVNRRRQYKELAGPVTVTDLLTGKKYKWEAAPCSSTGCFCDAVVTEVK